LKILPERQIVRFHCGCSFKRVLGALKMFGVEELRDMIEKDNGAKATCEFCGEVFEASSQDLSDLIDELQGPAAEIPVGQLRRSSRS
ncbi:MAG: redox-regulated molecular chaperone Hsp33, partial [Okeania sp. SIO2H7]|nr:redox-regulated molecular chaperone Hsp33 [Okeania sp. SIO2H7]